MIGTFQDVIRDMESSVYDYTKGGKCVGCGRCCSNLLPLSVQEIRNIRQYMKRHNIKEQKHVFPTREPTFDLTCPFLNESGGNQKCTIYQVRPHICVAFICNQPPSKIRENKENFRKTRKVYNIRETFF